MTRNGGTWLKGLKTLSWTLLAATVVAVSCGKKEKNDDNTTVPPATEESGDVIASQDGQDGLDGKNGRNGRDGNDGIDATDIVLADRHNQVIGYGSGDQADAADVFLPDGTRLLVNRVTGQLKTLLDLGVHCTYLSTDCNGACYLADSRWMNVIVRDVAGKLFVASASAVDQGSKTMLSFVDEAGICQQGMITPDASYIATPYTPANFTVPLAAPLKWVLQGAAP